MMDQTYFNKEDVLKCANGELDGFTGKLPLPNMLMIDRITHVDNDGGEFGKGLITAELDINPDMWFFACHFKDDPVMPGCLGLDALWQLTGFHLCWQGFPGIGRALGVGEVKFTGQILPTDSLVKFRVDIKRVVDRGITMIFADGSVDRDGEVIYTAKNMRVCLIESNQG